MSEPTIKIAYEMEDIAAKTMDEKLTLLLRIAFANHETLKHHGKVLFGNGESGICDVTRSHGQEAIDGIPWRVLAQARCWKPDDKTTCIHWHTMLLWHCIV